MNLTKKQTEEVLSNFLDKENGLNDVMQMMLNAMMYSERAEHLVDDVANKANGFRLGKVFGYGSQIELRIPRDRQSAFTPTILSFMKFLKLIRMHMQDMMRFLEPTTTF